MKTLDEIYKIHTFLHRSVFEKSSKFRQTYSHVCSFILKILFIFSTLVENSPTLVNFSEFQQFVRRTGEDQNILDSFKCPELFRPDWWGACFQVCNFKVENQSWKPETRHWKVLTFPVPKKLKTLDRTLKIANFSVVKKVENLRQDIENFQLSLFEKSWKP